MIALHGLFERRADRDPDRPAVSDGAVRLSYAELEAAANRLANRLAATAPPGSAVAVCLNAGVEALVAQLAVLKAGNVYVPLHPAHPAPRLRRAAAIAAVSHVVTRREHAGPLDRGPWGLVCLDDGVPGPDERRPERAVRPADAAYIVFTSGSTGEPKGVVVEHGAIVSTTQARFARYAEPVERFLLVSPFTFDSAMAGVWWTLGQGGELDIAAGPADGVLDAVEAALTGARPVSHTLMTPSLYGAALQRLSGPAAGPRVVVVAGEACPPRLVAEHFRLLPGTALCNEYGPTEAAVWCTGADLTAGEPEVVIGTPIWGAEVLVLDGAARPLPAGALGELCIGGAGLARGYAGRPDLTAERFVPHPDGDGRRIYRSGDVACRRADGQLELFGRLDDQVKVRGHRVELGEVEAELRAHESVAAAAAALRGSGADARLVGYVVPELDVAAAEREVRASWAQVVDDTATGTPAADPELDTSGWRSSYTGEPVPDGEMAEWAEATVRRLREREPRRVLELGCGTGMLLLRLAPGCERYVGVDLSRPIVERLRAEAARRGLAHVELRVGEAADPGPLQGRFDLVVLNSVTQYFPGADYLERVVRGALGALAPGGRLFVGDVRSRPLLAAFHASVAVAGAPDGVSGDALAARVEQRVRDDGQFVIDPGWFVHESGAAHVEIRPRRGRHANEMNRFRYDAVLSAGAPPSFDVGDWASWGPAGMTLGSLAHRLLDDAPELVALRDVPNRRTAGAWAMAERLRLEPATAEAGALRVLAGRCDAAAVDPEDLCRLAAAAGYVAHLSWAGERADGAFDAVLVRDGSALAQGCPRFPVAPRHRAGRDYANDPSRERALAAARAELPDALRARLAERLPEPMRPSAYVVLDALPLSVHGKVDRSRLPAPRGKRPAVRTAFLPATRPVERRIAELLAGLLGVDEVGLHDDFFELGGHSLLAAQAVSRLRRELGADLSLRTLLAAPTVAGLAGAVEAAAAGAAAAPVPCARTGRLPFSAKQQLLWYVEHYRVAGAGSSARFAIEVEYRLRGPLDAAALEAALREIVDRHEALRTGLRLAAGGGYQVVRAAPGSVLARHDVRGRPDVAAAAQDALRAAERQPLDPEAGRMLAADLVTVSDDEHLLRLRLHHMASDGWSLTVLERELESLYRDLAAGRPPGLAPLRLQYGDLAAWQDRTFFGASPWWEHEPYRRCLEYWRERARGLRPLRLPADGPDRSGTDEPRRTAVLTAELAPELAASVRELARAERTTPFAVLLTCFQELVRAESGDDDVRMFTLHADRELPDVEPMVGLLLEPVLMRTRFRPGWSFLDALREVRATVHEALAHQGVPALALMERVDELAEYLLESQFVAFECLPAAADPRLPDLQVRRLDQFSPGYRGAPFALPMDLLMIAREEGDALRLALVHDPALFSGSRMRRLLDRYRDLVRSALADPAAPLAAEEVTL